MTAIMYEKLFEPYTADGHTFEAMVKYLNTVATERRIDSEFVNIAVNEVFAELAAGREFSKTECSCGCGIDKAATNLIHAIRDRLLSLDQEKQVKVKTFMQEKYTFFLTEEMKRLSTFDKDREKLINGTLWENLTDWKSSRLYCAVKGLKHSEVKAIKKLKRIEKYLGK